MLATGVTFFRLGGGVIWATCFSGSLKGEKTQAEEQDIAINEKLNPQTSAWAFKDPDKLKELQEQGLVDKPSVGQTENQTNKNTPERSIRNADAKPNIHGERQDIQQIVVDEFTKHGFNPRMGLALVSIESSFDPEVCNGSYCGLMQVGNFSNYQKAYGFTKDTIKDPVTNLEAGIKIMKENINYFKSKKGMGREPTPGEVYLMHQQGMGGGVALLKNENELAHKVLAKYAPKKYQTQEEKEAYAIGNIRANLPKNLKAQASTMTAKDFANYWINKMEERYNRY